MKKENFYKKFNNTLSKITLNFVVESPDTTLISNILQFFLSIIIYTHINITNTINIFPKKYY